MSIQHVPTVLTSSNTSSYTTSRLSDPLSTIKKPHLLSNMTLPSTLESDSSVTHNSPSDPYRALSVANLPSARSWPIDQDLLGLGLAFHRTHLLTEHLYHLHILEEDCIERSPASKSAGFQEPIVTSNCAVAPSEAMIESVEIDDAVYVRPRPRTSWDESSMWDGSRRSMCPGPESGKEDGDKSEMRT